MRLTYTIFPGLLLACSPAFAQDDEFCSRLISFETAPLDETGTEQSRWIELHWRGQWLDLEKGWGLTCVSSPDPAAREFCNWLPRNTSYEFPEVFPISILRCHGFVLPKASDWRSWKSEIDLWHAEDRKHELIIDFATLEGETGAVRYLSVGEDAGDIEIEERPLTAMPPLEAK